MKVGLSSNNLEQLNGTVKSYIATLEMYLEVLNNKLSDCGDELRQLVTDTSIKFSERKKGTIELMIKQEKLQQLIEDIERIIVDKGDEK